MSEVSWIITEYYPGGKEVDYTTDEHMEQAMESLMESWATSEMIGFRIMASEETQERIKAFIEVKAI